MNPTEQALLQKLLETFENWNRELRAARDDYKSSVEKLNDVKIELEKQKKSKLQYGLDYAPWVIILLVLVLIASLMFTFQCGTFTYQDFSYSRPCK